MKNMIFVGLGGVLGTLLRYGVMVNVPTEWMLWVVNGFGSAAMGVLNGLFSRFHTRGEWRLFLTTGMLGAFTTFSAFSASWFQLLQVNGFMAMVYGVIMTILCVALASFGYLCSVPKVKAGGHL